MSTSNKEQDQAARYQELIQTHGPHSPKGKAYRRLLSMLLEAQTAVPDSPPKTPDTQDVPPTPDEPIPPGPNSTS